MVDCVCVACDIELCLLHVQIMSGCVVCGLWLLVMIIHNVNMNQHKSTIASNDQLS